MTFVGVDPGMSGAIAAIDDERRVVGVWRFDHFTDREIYTILDRMHYRDARGDGELVFAVLEHVHAMPRQGVSSTMKFGAAYGAARMALAAANIPFVEVTPQKWQAAMQCRSKGDKNVTKRRAYELFPQLSTISHATADALLLSEYCRRVEGDRIERLRKGA